MALVDVRLGILAVKPEPLVLVARGAGGRQGTTVFASA